MDKIFNTHNVGRSYAWSSSCMTSARNKTQWNCSVWHFLLIKQHFEPDWSQRTQSSTSDRWTWLMNFRSHSTRWKSRCDAKNQMCNGNRQWINHDVHEARVTGDYILFIWSYCRCFIKLVQFFLSQANLFYSITGEL